MTGWLLLIALYLIGVVHFVVEDRAAWQRQNLVWTWRQINRNQLAWPWFMLSETYERLR